MTKATKLTDNDLDTIAAGQTREHVLLSRQVSVQAVTTDETFYDWGIPLVPVPPRAS